MFCYLAFLNVVIVAFSFHNVPQQTRRFDQSLTMRTLLIDNFDSYTYNIWQLLSEVNGEEPLVVYNNAFNYDWDELLLQLPKFDNIVISPGPGSPDVTADFGICRDAILRSNLPVLGVCLGHQGIAYSFGGVVNRAKVPMHGRLSAVSHTNEGLFQNIPQETNVVRYHSLVVENETLPPELRVTAWTSDNVIMGLQHISKPIYGVQFHPESVCTDCGKQLFTNFKELSEKYHKEQQKLIFPVGNVIGNTDSIDVKKILIEEVQKNAAERVVKKKHICIVKKKYDCKVDIESIFKELYGSSTASFWLDSSSSGPVQGRSDNSTPLSFFGDLDSSSTSHAIEYYGSNRLVKRTGQSKATESYTSNIFEYMDKQLENSKNNTEVIHFYEDLGLNSGMKTFQTNENNDKNEDNQNIFDIPFNVTSAYFGFLGYEARHEATEILTLPYKNTYEKYNLSATHREGFKSSKWANKLSHPMALFMYPSQYVVFNHVENAVFVVSDVDLENSESNTNTNIHTQSLPLTHTHLLTGYHSE